MNTITDSLPQGVFILNESGAFSIINPVFLNIVGYDFQELEGKDLGQVFPVYDHNCLDVFFKDIEKHVRGEKLFFEVRTKSGETRPVSLLAIKLDARSGISLLVFCEQIFSLPGSSEKSKEKIESRYRRLFEFNPLPLFEEDFSELRKSLAQIKSRENVDLRTYLECHPNLVFELIGQIKITDTNLAAVEFHGCRSKKELIGNLTPFTSEENRKAYIDELLAISENRRFNKVEKIVVLPRDKTFRFIDFYWMVASDDDETWSKVIISLIDNTELHNRQEALRRRESNLAEASTLAHLGYFEIDLPLGTGFWSQEIFNIVGRNPALGQLTIPEFRALVFPDDLEKFDRAIEDTIHHNKPIDVEFRITPAQDSMRYVHAVAETDPDPTLKGQRILGALMDITSRKENEIQQMRNQVRLAEAARLTSVGKLAAGIAHQLFNPLTTIIAESQMLRQILSDQAFVVENIEDIEAAGWKAQRIVQLLSEFSQPPTTTQTIIQVNDTIQKALRLVGTQLLIDGISINKHLSADLPEIPGYSQRLENLWVNLFLIIPSIVEHNCIPILDIYTNFDEKWITISLKAEGCVFPANLITTDSLTALETPESQSLIGLEISVCKEIVRQINGNLNIINEDHASTFIIVLPREPNDQCFTDINR